MTHQTESARASHHENHQGGATSSGIEDTQLVRAALEPSEAAVAINESNSASINYNMRLTPVPSSEIVVEQREPFSLGVILPLAFDNFRRMNLGYAFGDAPARYLPMRLEMGCVSVRR